MAKTIKLSQLEECQRMTAMLVWKSRDHKNINLIERTWSTDSRLMINIHKIITINFPETLSSMNLRNLETTDTSTARIDIRNRESRDHLVDPVVLEIERILSLEEVAITLPHQESTEVNNKTMI